MMNVKEASGIDNLLYSSDVDFSCFADLAVVSPVDYRKESEGSLMQARLCSAFFTHRIQFPHFSLTTLRRSKASDRTTAPLAEASTDSCCKLKVAILVTRERIIWVEVSHAHPIFASRFLAMTVDPAMQPLPFFYTLVLGRMKGKLHNSPP